MTNKITVTSVGTTANVNATPDSARYYSDKSKEWAISDKLIDNEDYSSKYYANESKKQADISTAKTTEVIESGNTAVSNIESAREKAITDIVDQENLSVDNVNTAGSTQVTNVNNAGITQVNNVNTAGTNQVNLAKEQVTIATNQATIATTQAGIATAKTIEVVESGNTALSNIVTAKSSALNEINTTGAGYVNNAEQYAQNALNSANNAAVSESNALSYKNSALESSQIAIEQTEIATTQAGISTSKAGEAITSATNAKISETNAKSSETRCEEILSRLGTVIKIKGRVDSVGDLPLGDNLDGDAYLVGGEGLDSYPEYYWYQDHWEFLGTTGTSLSWGLISGDISNQTDLQTVLNNKQNKGNYALKSEIPTKTSQLTNDSGFINNDSTFVHKTGNETVAGIKTFSSTINGNTTSASKLNGFGTTRTEFWGSVNATAKTGKIINSANTPNDGAYIFSERKLNNGANLDFIIDGKFYQNEGAYQVLDTSTGVTHTTNTAVGSATKPVYINSNGVATAITSYGGNSATATKATKDGDGNVITSTYLKKTEGYHPPLLSTVWADHLLNDMSWLRADTFSWQDGNTYSTAYNELLSEYNNSASTTKTDGSITYKRTPKGYKIALATQETAILNKYNSDGIAWYYILDTTNKRFKLPRAKHPSLVSLSANAPVVGNGITLGLTDGRNNFGLRYSDGTTGFTTSTNGFGKSLPSTASFGNSPSSGSLFGVTTDPTKSGMVADLSNNVKDYNMYLYFYVGAFTKSAEAQTAGLKAELLNGKADVDTPSIQAPYLKTTYVNGASGYRIWSDGYCEQWGLTSKIADYGTATVNLLKSFKDLNYTITKATMMPGSGDDSYFNDETCIRYATRTNSSFEIYNRGATDGGRFVNWKACGYLASGQY